MIDLKQEVSFIITDRSQHFSTFKECGSLTLYQESKRLKYYKVSTSLDNLLKTKYAPSEQTEYNYSARVKDICTKCGGEHDPKLVSVVKKNRLGKDLQRSICPKCKQTSLKPREPKAVIPNNTKSLRNSVLRSDYYYKFMAYGGRRDIIVDPKIKLPLIKSLDVNFETMYADCKLKEWLTLQGFSTKADRVKRFKSGKQFLAVAVFPANGASYRGYAYIAIAITNQELFPIFIESIGERISFNKWMNLN